MSCSETRAELVAEGLHQQNDRGQARHFANEPPKAAWSTSSPNGDSPPRTQIAEWIIEQRQPSSSDPAAEDHTKRAPAQVDWFLFGTPTRIVPSISSSSEAGESRTAVDCVVEDRKATYALASIVRSLVGSIAVTTKQGHSIGEVRGGIVTLCGHADAWMDVAVDLCKHTTPRHRSSRCGGLRRTNGWIVGERAWCPISAATNACGSLSWIGQYNNKAGD